MISVKFFYSRRKEYNQHEPSQFHCRDATDGICTCIRMFGIAVNKAQQLSLAMEILAKGKKKKKISLKENLNGLNYSISLHAIPDEKWELIFVATIAGGTGASKLIYPEWIMTRG